MKIMMTFFLFKHVKRTIKSLMWLRLLLMSFEDNGLCSLSGC